MADTVIDVHQHGAAGHDDHHHEPNWFVKYFWSTDHKIIAMQYMFTGMFMGIIGGYMAYVFRMQLAFPGISVPGFGQVSPGDQLALNIELKRTMRGIGVYACQALVDGKVVADAEMMCSVQDRK